MEVFEFRSVVGREALKDWPGRETSLERHGWSSSALISLSEVGMLRHFSKQTKVLKRQVSQKVTWTNHSGSGRMPGPCTYRGSLVFSLGDQAFSTNGFISQATLKR